MMARGVAPPGSDSSSSGFSSDEDIDDVPQQLNAASSVPNVQVEVLNEDVKADQNSDAVSAIEVPPAALSALTGVNSCCLEASRSVLDAETPFAVQYDQYTAAIGHITYHWPNSELYDAMTVEEGLKQYHMLRMELYRRFQKAYPLTEDMYMQWIGDASAIGGEETVKKLFKLARGDYWSVPLTLQYLNFIRDSGDAAALERAMDEAQKTLGTHFARGHEIWALCRELTTDKFDEQEDGELEKERALRDLFCKQMQLPLDQNDLVMSEFRAWDAYNSLDGEATGRLEKASERQSKTFAPLMKKLRGFEARLTAAPGTEEAANPEQTWTQYLNFVKHRVAPLMANDKAAGMSELGRQIVVCLYERAVSSMCLSPTIWASYLDFLEPDKSGACGSEKVDVAYRAVRNVSFDSSAWSELFVEMERQRKSMHEISQFARAELLTRSSPPIMDQFHFLTALLTWCDAVRRYASTSINGKYLDDTVQKVESLVGGVFTECEEFMAKTFPDFYEGVKRLVEYRSKCYWTLMPPGTPRLMPATAMKVGKIKQLWKQKLSTSLGEQASAWLAYLGALQRTGALSVTTLRVTVFDEAVQRVKDSPLTLAEAWVVFERECGDLDNYIRARRHHAKLRAARPSIAASQTITSTSQSANAGDTNKTKNAKNIKKRKASGGSEQAKPKQSEAKRAKTDASAAISDSAATEISLTAKDLKSTSIAAQKKVIHKNLTNEHTLFLCNVSKDATKENVEALFKDISTLKDVRLVVKTRGDRVKSRGMAYVQFTDEAGVEEGLKLNGSLLDGHPLRVERSKPPSTSASTPGAKPSTCTQKNDPVTLFVGDLNVERSKQQVTEEQLQVALQQAMQSAGELVVVTRVSILKDRYGKLKNYGLVELAEPSQVAFCLSNAAALQAKLSEQVTVKPSRFSIAHILEQQEKQQKQTQQRKAGAAAKAGAVSKGGANGPHARPSTRLNIPTTSLMPRALRRKLAAQDTAAKTTTSEPTNATTVTPKSNEDFRKMLFKK